MSTFLSTCIISGTTINVITINGFHIRGKLTGYHQGDITHGDLPYLTMQSDGKEKRIFCHAISTIEVA